MIKSFRKHRKLSEAVSPKRSIRVAGTHPSDGDAILQSPKKVIKALYDYTPQGPGELGFKKGDFFHVLNEADDEDHREALENGWYEATNPATQAKGMVPISYFEVFGRLRPIINTPVSPTKSQRSNSHASSTANSSVRPSFSTSGGGTGAGIGTGPGLRNSSQTLYAVTLYEFNAEREDELDISPGENLIICAHHEYEWFIAKPINRLGGPGLVPVSYVRIIDLLNPNSATPNTIDTTNHDDVVRAINSFKIPTVEQWKDQTAKYQASTIPLGSISGNQPLVSSQNSQYFDGNNANRNTYGSMGSSVSSTQSAVVEASVDSYQLDNGRYQYLITARLANGKIRYLYRYYQDFYDLQVRLLELFPFEAGKIENSKRIIPSIPGPLINVNDSISKLRREKLDYYLRNLIALPAHISRSEEVLRLFEVLDNGFDKEIESLNNNNNNNNNRVLKPISQKSTSHNDRLSQYSNLNPYPRVSDPTSNSAESGLLNRGSNESSTTNMTAHDQLETTTAAKQSKIKVKFYYEDDIFVLLLPTMLRLQDLKTKLHKRLELDDVQQHSFDEPKQPEAIRLYLKNDYDDFAVENNISDYKFSDVQKMKLAEFEVDNDEKFHRILYEKCKMVILVD